jgi:lysophospholipase L1-like esterase
MRRALLCIGPLFLLAAAARADQAAVAPPPLRLLALGDSFTIGTGSSPDRSFPARLAARLRARGRAVALRNLGVNGYTTDDLIERELPEVHEWAPTLVTLAIGANDLVRGSSPERYRLQLRRIFAALKLAGVPSTQVVALPQPDWSLSPVAAAFGAPSEIGARIRRFNEVLRDEALSAGARFVDLFPIMEQQAHAGMIADDGLHPSALAYDQWAAELERRKVP